MLIAMTALFLIVSLQAAQPTVIPSAVLMLVPVLAGAVGVPLVNFIKKRLGWITVADKNKNLWMSFAVSIVLALIAEGVSGVIGPVNITSPDLMIESVVGYIGVTYATAQLIYKSMTG